MTPEKDRLIAGQLDRMGYDTLRVLGVGAFATVYLVQDKINGRKLACKVSGHTNVLQREAKILQQVNHPLFPVYEGYVSGEQNGFLFQEAVEGLNLRQYMEQSGRLSQRQVLSIAYEVSGGLQYLHECSCPVLFLDIKPDHIMLQPDGRVRMVDFGSAAYCGKLAGMHTGTAGYSAPEQLALGAEPGTASDIYGLAATMWYLLTGTLPEAYGKTDGTCAISARLCHVSLSPAVHRFLKQCLQYEMENRIPNMCYVHYKIGIFLRMHDRGKWVQFVDYFAQNILLRKPEIPQNIWIFEQNVGKMS